MKFGDYLKDKSTECLLFVSVGIVTALFLIILEVGLPVILICELPFFAVYFLGVYLDYKRKKAYYDALLQAVDELDQKSYLADVVKKPRFAEGKVCHSILKQLGKDMNDHILKRETGYLQYKNYIESWVHEVKLPIASSKLLIENNKSDITLSLEEELDRIDNYVEQVLYYARSENVEQDYHLEQTELEPVVRQAVKRYARDFIYHKVTPSIEVSGVIVTTDSKWLSFILGQLIQNSIKYRGTDAKIQFFISEKAEGITLCVEDNGIGISQKDISRVFDKGYTGENTRASANATGMGLYLCRQLCTKMGLDLGISSEVGRGTCIRIGFPKGERSSI